MKFWKWSRKKNNNESLPMHKSNILMIASSAMELDIAVIAMKKSGYVENSEIMILDNGDFAQVVKKKGD